jgi:hypothetical protein
MTATQTAVTADQIIAEVRRLASEQPDFIYQNPAWEGGIRGFCRYMHGENEPGCIMGHALYNLGLTPPAEGGVADVVQYDLGIGLTPSQAKWLSDVQRHQDRGETWATAVAWASDVTPNV